MKDRFLSPFRYPGGKGFIAPIIDQLISAGGLRDVVYIEPFAGGAAAGLKLLSTGAVARIILNDLDYRIYSAWHSIVHETDRFLVRLADTRITIDTWYAFRTFVEEATSDTDSFELGFSTFILNRTNRSGILLGSAPIGGYDQTGNWKIDARLNRDALAKRIEWIGNNRKYIELSNADAVSLISKSMRDGDKKNLFYFIDPPYVAAGSRLYFNGMNETSHRLLSKKISELAIPNWLMTYDDHPLIGELYAAQHIGRIETVYSLNRKRKEREVVVFPNRYLEAMRPYLAPNVS